MPNIMYFFLGLGVLGISPFFIILSWSNNNVNDMIFLKRDPLLISNLLVLIL